MHVLSPQRWEKVQRMMLDLDFIEPIQFTARYPGLRRPCIAVTGSLHAGVMFPTVVAHALMADAFCCEEHGPEPTPLDLVEQTYELSQRMRQMEISSSVSRYYLPHVVVAGEERRAA